MKPVKLVGKLAAAAAAGILAFGLVAGTATTASADEPDGQNSGEVVPDGNSGEVVRHGGDSIPVFYTSGNSGEVV